jgi:predicted O-methyltransferase YrrM
VVSSDCEKLLLVSCVCIGIERMISRGIQFKVMYRTMEKIRALGKLAIGSLGRIQAQKTLERIRAIQNPDIDKIANAIDFALNRAPADKDQAWIDKLETLRESLNGDPTELTVTDFGSGSPVLTRTQETMASGVKSKTRVCDICKVGKPKFWALILFNLIRQLKPVKSLELGTCLGISASYQGAAKKLNGDGQLITMEGSNSLADIAEKNFEILGLENIRVVRGSFQSKLGYVLAEEAPFDFVFIDGHHDEKATIDYFESILPVLAAKAVIVFDDISWSPGMQRAWQQITRSDSTTFSVDLRTIGICYFDKNVKRESGLRFRNFYF